MMLTDWLAPQPRLPGRIPVPDVRGLFYSVCLELVGRLDLQVIAVRLTQHPMRSTASSSINRPRRRRRYAGPVS
jgi:hypothetical protein